MEAEYDVFFEDLSKQISLLIMDDDEESLIDHCPSVNPQDFAQAMYPEKRAWIRSHNQPISYSKGTGVFIPRSSLPRKTNPRQGRFIASSNKFQRPNFSYHKSRELPNMTYYNISPSYYDSSNYRRF